MTELIEFKLPELGENIEQGDLVRLMVSPGAKVDAGQSVMELETDKAVVEVPSSVSGTVHEIRVKEGEKIKVGQVIFTVDGSDGKPAASPTPGGCSGSSCAESSGARFKRVRFRVRFRLRQQRPGLRLLLHRLRERANSSFQSWAKTSRRAIWCG